MATLHHRRKGLIYKSWGHVLATIGIILIPFIFIIVFANIGKLDLGMLFTDLGTSLGRLVVAYLIAVVIGWGLAVSFFRGKSADVALPVFDVLQSFPTFAVLPLATYFWGGSNVTVIFFLVITIIWPILFSIISSLKLMRSEWEEAIEIYNIRGFTYIKKFLLPVSIPGLITGTIVGLGEGWEALVATEIIAGIHSGLGPFFDSYSHNVNVTAFGVLGFLLIIFSVNKLIWLPLLEWGHKLIEE